MCVQVACRCAGGVVASPLRVELAVVCAEDVDLGLHIELVCLSCERDVVVLLLTHHGADVLVVGAVDEKIVNIANLDRVADRSVLVDYRCDRDDGCDVEVVVESDIAVFGVVV